MENSIEKKITTLLRQFTFYTMLFDNHKIATSISKTAMEITFEVLNDTKELPDELKSYLQSILKKEAVVKIKAIDKILDSAYTLIEETFQKNGHKEWVELDIKIKRTKSLVTPNKPSLPDPETLLGFCAIRIKELKSSCDNYYTEQFFRDEKNAKVKLIILQKLGLIETLKRKVKTDDKVAEILFLLTSIPSQYSSKLIGKLKLLELKRGHFFTEQSLDEASRILKNYNFKEEAESLIIAKAKILNTDKKK